MNARWFVFLSVERAIVHAVFFLSAGGVLVEDQIFFRFQTVHTEKLVETSTQT